MSTYSVKRPITVLMGIMITLVVGIISITTMNLSLFPDMELPFAVVVTTYQGADPYEVEEEVSKKIEAVALTSENYSEIYTQSNEHFSMSMITFTEGTNMDSAVLTLRENIDNISFAEGVEKPKIMRFSPDSMPIVTLSLSKDFGDDLTEEEELIKTSQWLETEIEDVLRNVSGVADVSFNGMVDAQIKFELDETKGSLYGFDSLEKVKSHLELQNVEGFAGVAIDQGEILMVYFGDKAIGLEQLGNTPMAYDEINEQVVYLKDIIVEDSLRLVNANPFVYSKVNGEPTIQISFLKQTDVSLTETSNNITKALDKIVSESNGTVEYNMILDQGDYVNLAIGTILENLIIGGVLAVVILLLFLKNIKATVIVTIAIPVSVIGTFVLMYFTGISLNLFSMGGLALGIGMLVDNSVVVIENITRMLDEGKSKKDAAIYGAKQVAAAITASTITTVVVFLPVLFMGGMIVDVFMSLAATICYSLLASLIIALTLVPSMSAKFLTQKKNLDQKSFRKTKEVYTKVLSKSLDSKLIKTLSIIIVIVLLFGSIALVTSKGFEMMPTSDEGSIDITMNLTEELEYAKVSAMLDDLTEKIQENKNVSLVSVTYGNTGGFMGMGATSANSAKFSILRSATSTLATDKLLEEIKPIFNTNQFNYEGITTDDIVEIEFKKADQTQGMLGGTGVKVEILGHNLTDMEKVTTDIHKIVEEIEGTRKVTNTIKYGQDIVSIVVDKDMAIKKNLASQNILDSLQVFYDSMGMTQNSANNNFVIEIDGVEYPFYTEAASGFDDMMENMTFNSLFSMVQLFDTTTLNSINKYLETNSSIYAPNKFGIGINPLLYVDVNGQIVSKMTPDASDKSLASLAKTTLVEFNPLDQTMTSSVATIERIPGFSSIHSNGKYRVLEVNGLVEEGYNITPISNELNKKVEDYLNSADFKAIDSYIEVNLIGENEEIMASFSDLIIAAVAAILLVYMVIAIQFQSLKNPLIILGTIPLAFTGGMLALLITNSLLNIVSIMGFIILVGVVVNNGIVLIDYITKLREEGMSKKDAIINASVTRIRPILMTSLTTILALVPTALGLGNGGEMLTPLAITAIGGMMYATVLTLFIVPIVYSITNKEKDLTQE